MRTIRNLTVAIVAMLVSFPAIAGAQIKVDAALPEYKPVGAIAGKINSVGTDTMNNLMTLWDEGFRKYYPNVRVEAEGKAHSVPTVGSVE